MLPFKLDLRHGVPVHQQIHEAVKRAIVGGLLRPGDRFPSVRQLSLELRINPNTAHKVTSALVAEGVLEVHPGIGTVVASRPPASATEREALLEDRLQRLVIEARHLRLSLDDVRDALERHWRALGGNAPDEGLEAGPKPRSASGGRDGAPHPAPQREKKR